MTEEKVIKIIKIDKDLDGKPDTWDDIWYIVDLDKQNLVWRGGCTMQEAINELGVLETKGGNFELLQAVKYSIEEVKTTIRS